MSTLNYSAQKRVARLFHEIDTLQEQLSIYSKMPVYRELVINLKKNIRKKYDEISEIREYGE